MGDAVAMGARFAARYRAWEGRVPPDDLWDFQAWYASQAPHAAHVFKVAALTYILRAKDMPGPAIGRLVARDLEVWFPPADPATS